MAKQRNRLFVWLNTAALIGFSRVTAALPLPVCRLLGRWCGRLGYWVIPRIRRVGLANLDLAYGEALSRAEKRRLIRRCGEGVATTAAEFSRIPRLKGDFLRRQVTIRGAEHVDASRGTLLIAGHLGNWEWMAPAVCSFREKVVAVVQEFRDPRLGRLVDEIRRSGGISTIPKEGCGPELVRLLKEGWVVGVLVDQSPRDSGVPVRFFGQSCWATIAPAMLAARANVPVHAASMARDRTGHYTLTLSPPLELAHTGDLMRDFQENCQRCQDVIEALVRAHPDQWLWIHRRWKARPRLEQEWRARVERHQASRSQPEPD